MNKKLGLAVAGALLAASASAQAGITIPAGDWTLDINGNVNAYANWTHSDKTKGTAPVGGLAGTADSLGDKSTQGINTGLLPAWLGFTGKSRQNDLDVEFTISFQPNVSDNFSHGDAKTPLNRQAYFSFGDASWGSVKLGKDLGIFAADAILNDMTLLGVGGGAANSGGATTLGGIGSGYIYAAWKGQIAYTTPNWNGFQATVGITNPNQGFGTASDSSSAATVNQDRFGYEAKASYAFTGDVAGKVWASMATYDVTTTTGVDYTARAWDIGATASYQNFGLTGYYYDGKGAGTTLFGAQGATAAGKRRDSDGGYVQATYKLPVGTKLGVAYGVSKLDEASGETNATLVAENKRWTFGAYHPLTKSVNLVAEYNRIKSEGQVSSNNTESDTFSLGGILFF
jgi:predicted porin